MPDNMNKFYRTQLEKISRDIEAELKNTVINWTRLESKGRTLSSLARAAKKPAGNQLGMEEKTNKEET